jgi:protein ImuB
MVVQCPDWPVVASGELRSSTVDVPAVAVVAANRVVACSEAARVEGVERGLRRRQAESRCPGLVVVADDPGRQARVFEPVVAAVEAFTPGVEIVRPGTCAFPTRGPSRYFGGDESLAAKVAAAVDAVLSPLAPGAPRCRVGVADGRLAAELATRSPSTGDAGRIVPPGGSRAFLAPFPVSVLDGYLGAGTAELTGLLVRLGIHTLGDLAALPLPAVLARFGTAGAAACRLARGLDERPLAARTPPPDLAVTARLDPPADRLETVAFVARSLADQLHRELATRGLAATRVLVEAETEHGEWLARRWRHDGGLTPAALAERVRWQLDGWLAGRTTGRPPGGEGQRTAGGEGQRPAGGDGRATGRPAGGGAAAATGVPTGGLVLLRLTPDEVGPDDGRQMGFWGGDRAAAERAGRALARVQGVLGPESVVTACLAGGRGPAEQVRLVPWDDARPEPTGDGSGGPGPADRHRFEHPPPWPGRIPAPAPATVHPRPVPAEVVDTVGRAVTVTGRATITAPPARLAVAGGALVDVTAWAGPWPVDERWWDPAAHRRRARAQVVTADGTARLLAVEGGRWVVEATYD